MTRHGVFVLGLVLTLTGCSTTRPAWLENRVACTVDRSQLHALSVWGPFSIGSRIADTDATAVCQAKIDVKENKP